MTLRMPAGLRRHLSMIGVFTSWMAKEGRDGFHEDTSFLAGSPAFNKFTEGCNEEGLLAKVHLCLPIHDLTSLVDVKSFSGLSENPTLV